MVDEYELYCDEDFDVVPLIDAAAFFNSINVFKFLLISNPLSSPTIQTMNMFSMYRHNNYEIFRFCEINGITPNDDTLLHSFNSLNIDLFVYINTHYQNLYTFEYFPRISCYIPDIVNGGVSICGKKFGDIRKQFVEAYPIVFESFLKSDTNNLLRFEEVLGKYFRLSSYPFKEKIELPTFEQYSILLFPKNTIEDAMLKTAADIFKGNKLSFHDFSEALIKIFKDDELVQNHLETIYDKTYEFGVMDFFDILEILEKDHFYKNCFEQTFKIYPNYDFWKSWIDEMGNAYFCCDFIRNELQKYKLSQRIPSYDTADFFESIEE